MTTPHTTTTPAAEPRQDPHHSLHSEVGAQHGEHPGRSSDPVVKVAGLAWLEFEKPDLVRAERFLTDFGFTLADRTPDELRLRGTWTGPACLVVRRAPTSRFAGVAFQAAGRNDVLRLAEHESTPVTTHRAGVSVTLHDPSGLPVRVVHGVGELAALPERAPLPMNFGTDAARVNVPQRPAARPAQIERLGHVVLGTSRFRRTLDWYLDTLGLLVSDFLYLDGQRERGPAMAFIRCDQGSVPTDHHTLAIALQPRTGYVHSAYQLTDLDEVAASGTYLHRRGYRHVWGIGRHIQGSQIFDYWRDDDRLMFEHYTDGDVFDCTVEPGWAPLSVSGLAQWGPRATARFTGAREPATVLAAINALRERGNDVDLAAVRALVKAMSS
jgi:catechol 2,3-dioxygenase-like lactoylglutathione lyase family enzyme